MTVSTFKTAAEAGFIFCSMTFPVMGHERSANAAFRSDARFEITKQSAGSHMTVRMKRDDVDAFSGKLQELGISMIGPNQRVSFVNGSENPCETYQHAIRMAFDHS